jgi:hypothetical protein
MRLVSPVVLGWLLAACGGEDGAPIDAPTNPIDAPIDAAMVCASGGSGTSTGTVAGTAISPVSGAFVLRGTLWEVGIVESGNCATAPGGQFLDIQFCSEPAVGQHTLVPHGSMNCPGTAGSAYYVDEDAGTTNDVVGGTVTFTAIGDCTMGSYDLEFTGGGVTGTFNAISCP